MYLQKVDDIMDIEWGPGVTWGDLNMQAEREFSAFHFKEADTEFYSSMFYRFEEEASRMIGEGLILPAYDYVLKCSHLFNVLDARGAISVSERTSYIGRIRDLARRVAESYVEQRRELGFPLLKTESRGGRKRP